VGLVSLRKVVKPACYTPLAEHINAQPVRLAAIGCPFFPIQHRQVWQCVDSATLRESTNARREEDSKNRIQDLAEMLVRRLQTLDQAITEVPPRQAAPLSMHPLAPSTVVEAWAAASAAAGAPESAQLTATDGSEEVDAHVGVTCSTNWISADGDKTRADLLCAFTGPRDEGIVLLTGKLGRMGLSGRIRCAPTTASQYTLDDAGRQRHVAVNKVFTSSEQLKAALWTERGGSKSSEA
jgi:hypothetical protein